MTQKRIFAFLWPDPAPGPVDSAARQVRFLRVSRRGPLRILVLLLCTLVTFTVALLGAIALMSGPTIPALLVLVALVGVLACVTVRGWQLGTYVSDHGVRIIRLTRTNQHTWPEVTSIETVGDVVTLGVDPPVPTHIRARGLDHLGDRESYDMARDRIFNWWRGR